MRSGPIRALFASSPVFSRQISGIARLNSLSLTRSPGASPDRR